MDIQTRFWSLTALDRVSSAVSPSLALETVLESGLAALIKTFGFETGGVVMRNPNDLKLHLACQMGVLPSATARWLTDEVGGGRLMCDPQLLAWPNHAHQQLSPEGTYGLPTDLVESGQSLACAPLQVEDETLGVVALASARARELSPVELATFGQASDRLALAVRNALRYRLACNGSGDHVPQFSSALKSTDDRDHLRVSLLYQVARELGGQLDTDQLLGQILALAPRLGAEFAYIIVEERDGTLHFKSTAPGREEFVGAIGRRLARRMLQNGVEGWVLEHRHPLLIVDTLADARWYKAPYLLEIDRSALCVPLPMGRAGARGAWTLTSSQPGAFRADDVPLAESVAAQVAVALENTLLFRAESERSAQLSLINEVSQAAASILNLDLMLNTVAEAIHRRFGYLRVSIFLVDAKAGVATVRGRADTYPDGLQIGHQQRLGEGLVGRAAQESQTMLANDVASFPNYLRLGHSPKGGGRSDQQAWPIRPEKARAELAVPIRLGSKTVGVLDLQSEEIDAFNPNDVATMETLADQLSIAIENVRLYDEIRHRVNELTTLNEIIRAITSTLDLQEALTIITDHITRLLGVAATSVVLYDKTEGDLWFAAASGEGSDYVRGKRLAMGQGVAGWVVQHGEPTLVPDVSKDPRWFSDFDKENDFTTCSILCVPLQAKGQTIGAFEAMNKENGPFDQEDLRLMKSLAAPAATAIENARLYEELRQGMRRLEETQAQLIQSAKLAAVGELAAGVAHEINNPLTSIIGFTRLLLEDLPPDHQMYADLETIDREAARARQIVRGLLDFARAGDPVLAPVDLNALVEETVMLVYTRSVQAKVSLAKDLLPLPQVMLDANQIKQVLVNLLNNAVQAMPDDGQLTVATRLTECEIDDIHCPMAAVYVSDSGVGIPPENLERIFDPFFTTKEVGQGTGLGLSVSYSIIKKHNGKIEVESAPGVGSTFTILLPTDGVYQGTNEAETRIDGE
jgi:signal transduction histidine kinase